MNTAEPPPPVPAARKRAEPWLRRTARGLVGIADRFQTAPPLDAASLMGVAERRARSSDWGPYSIREPLDVLVQSLSQDVELSPFGRRYLQNMIVDTAVQRLKLVQVMQRLGNVEQQSVPKPLFIVGLPRTGTTLLYNLLCCDPNRRPLNIWEGYQPYDPRWLGRPDFRKLKTRVGVSLLNAFLPELKPIHEINPTGPEECFSLLHRTFVSATFYGIAPASSYLKWLLSCPDEIIFAAYGFYRSQLKLLQWKGDTRPWVLKNPAHLCGLRGLLHAFPDACIVQTHRDLANVSPSWLSLLSVARQLTVVDPDKEDYLADVAIYADLLKSAIDTRAKAEDRFFDVHYKDVVRDPLASVHRIYDHFGLEFTDELDRRARQWLADHPRGKHGEHRYTLEQFGLTREYLHERLAFYSERFHVAAEAS